MQQSAPKEEEIHNILHQKTITFLRDEVDRRYRLDYLQEIPELEEKGLLEGITQEMVDRVKDFFREVLYPTGEDRETRDTSVDRIMAILNNPGRMLELLPKMPFFVFRYGGSLLTAARAGLQVIASHRLSIRIEREAVENLEDLCREEDLEITAETEIPQELFRRAFARIPERQTEEMISHLKKITRLGMQPRIIEAAKELFHEIRKSLRNDDERAAVDYAFWVMEQLESQVRDHSKELMERLLTIAEIGERYYLNELRSMYV